ncbi:exodeoxyribonuclease V subunit alpha [Aliifodinibius salicampi]|uniref:Exodeoxyribonuclease V subunit alpha n=1 Tax=Fodinibius salicampi TaxID=1920655 RepID=A0ABT3PW93_9BACT|nr:exodeoxyribonuclease V subunit alpha [Fodinibius salicampi]MCW9712116.1 exodeoxyribonuclease V subunit alpha [Fodinibius salicampi]
MDNLLNKLEQLRREDIIRPIDMELCRFLCDQHPNISECVLKSACVVSYLYRQGDICLPLNEYADQQVFKEGGEGDGIKLPELDPWLHELKKSTAVGTPGDYRPLILDDSNRLYMHKLWHYEHTLGEELIKKSNQQVPGIDKDLLRDGLNRLFTHSPNTIDWQQVAAATSVYNKLSIISGGPGTGKTSTVVRVLALILEQYQKKGKTPPNIALSAPTGKAAARLKDSILSAKEGLDVSNELRDSIPEKAQTLHQLLGARRYSSQFRHNADNPVPYDLVIVDEASMVDQALMSKLVEALLEDAQLILLGDKDQLASVEAGSVLGDICNISNNKFSEMSIQWLSTLGLKVPSEFSTDHPTPLIDNITLLTKSYRFEEQSGIAQLASAVNKGDAEQFLSVLEFLGYEDLSFFQVDGRLDLESMLEKKIVEYFNSVNDCNSRGKALDQINEFRILTAHRRGPGGVTHLNSIAEKILQGERLVPKYQEWYPGKPVIINKNDYLLDLFNGDIGLCMPDEEGALKVHFRGEGSVRSVSPERLPEHKTAFALTVHKSQGSEFDEVFFVLPNMMSKVVSRELIYTAITRARSRISILGKKAVLKKGIEQKLRRNSGLADYLWGGK